MTTRRKVILITSFTVLLVTGVLIGFVGCTPLAREVSGAELLANRTSDPLDNMVYRGSDETYHYFDRAQFKTTKHFKVRHEAIVLPANLKVGQIPWDMRAAAATSQPAKSSENMLRRGESSGG